MATALVLKISYLKGVISSAGAEGGGGIYKSDYWPFNIYEYIQAHMSTHTHTHTHTYEAYRQINVY
jgi:predicted transcriptional regulator